MQATDYQTFVSMFQALDAFYDESRSEKVLAFLGDADPHVWKGHTSADPAVFIEFSEAFAKRFSAGTADPEDAMMFVREYLATQNDEYSWIEGDLVAAFDSVVTPELWEQALRETDE